MKHSIIKLENGSAVECFLHEKSLAMPQQDSRPAVVVLPGGGYEFVSDKEADPVALAFFAKGYQAFILRYSVLGGARDLNPLQDVAGAILRVRQNAAQWGINPAQVVVCGFSAGGHLAGSAGILSGNPQLLARLRCHREDILPDAMVLCYPVVSSGEYAHRSSFQQLTGSPADDDVNREFSLEHHVTPETPPAFIWHAANDATVPVENSFLLAMALKKQGVPFELHIFEKGDHGASMCTHEVGTPFPHCAHWFELCVEWLSERLGLDI